MDIQQIASPENLNYFYDFIADYNNLLIVALFVLGFILKRSGDIVKPDHIPFVLVCVGGFCGMFLFPTSLNASLIIAGLLRGIAFAGGAVLFQRFIFKKLGLERLIDDHVVDKVTNKIKRR